jgi:hypothetical protein
MKTGDVQAQEMTRGERGMVWTGRIVSLLPVLSIDEFPMETYLEFLVRAGVGTNRLENAGPSVYRFAPARRGSVVCDPAYIGSRSGDSYRLPGRCDRHLRPNRGTASPAGPAHNGAARLAGDLSA